MLGFADTDSAQMCRRLQREHANPRQNRNYRADLSASVMPPQNNIFSAPAGKKTTSVHMR